MYVGAGNAVKPLPNGAGANIDEEVPVGEEEKGVNGVEESKIDVDEDVEDEDEDPDEEKEEGDKEEDDKSGQSIRSFSRRIDEVRSISKFKYCNKARRVSRHLSPLSSR